MNYVDLFRATLPETVLEIAALLVIVVDLGFLRKAANQTRVAVAALVGIAGCAAAIWAVYAAGWGGFGAGDELLLAAGGTAAVAQVAILVLTSLAILLARLDLGIEAAVLLTVLCFPSSTRLFAVILLRLAEGLNHFYRHVRITFCRRHRRR